MVEDFNNVQDQNLVDDQMVNQITDSANKAAGGVGAVVHPDDPAPASQTPPVPTIQEVLGDKVEEPTKPEPKVDSQINLPERKIVTDQAIPPPPPPEEPEPSEEEAKTTDEDGFVPAPDAAPETEAPADPPADDTSADDTPTDDTKTDEPASDDVADDPTDQPVDDPTYVEPADPGNGDDEELMEVKQEALEELSPLVSHLDLPPDKKFDTYMEILRASDDKTLVKPAMEAAKEIDDEDKRAQALLDVVNEVNYLTEDHEETT